MTTTIKYSKLLAATLAAIYFGYCALNPSQWHFIDNVNLMIHEAGHIIFWPFGEFIKILGGSLLQILLPVIFTGYFYFQKQFFSAALLLYWVGENFLNVYIYAADALRMNLPLLGGNDAVHDWNWLLIYTGQLHHANAIAGIIKTLGILIIIIAAGWSLKLSLFTDTDEKIIS